MLLEGIFAPITTPFYPDGRLYLRKLEHNADRYSRTPVAGKVVLGSTGEAVMLSDEETVEVLRIASESAAAEKILIAGVGRESVIGTLAMCEAAARFAYDVALVRTPVFYRAQYERRLTEIVTYYRAIADRSPLPLLLYSVPAYTRYDLPVEAIAELASHPNIIGLKDSVNSPERTASIVESTRSVKRTVTVTSTFTAVTGRMMKQTPAAAAATFVSAGSLGGGGAALAVAPPQPAIKTRTKEIGFQVLTGSTAKLVDSLEAGATGAVVGMAACAPQACFEAYTAWKEGDAALAAEKQLRLAHAGAAVAAAYGVPGIKYACDLNGYYGGRPRLPLLPLTLEEQETVAAAMSNLRN